jgi:hypothetical protein
MTVYTATFLSGWSATVKDFDMDAARRRFLQTGRGEPFTLTAGGTHLVWGNDDDDDYEEN